MVEQLVAWLKVQGFRNMSIEIMFTYASNHSLPIFDSMLLQRSSLALVFRTTERHDDLV